MFQALRKMVPMAAAPTTSHHLLLFFVLIITFSYITLPSSCLTAESYLAPSCDVPLIANGFVNARSSLPPNPLESPTTVPASTEVGVHCNDGYKLKTSSSLRDATSPLRCVGGKFDPEFDHSCVKSENEIDVDEGEGDESRIVDSRQRGFTSKFCSIPDEVTNGRLYSAKGDGSSEISWDTEFEIGRKVRLACDDGYLSSNGSITAVCKGDGKWSRPLAICLEQNLCPPPEIVNGQIIGQDGGSNSDGDITEDNFPRGSTRHFQCDPGFRPATAAFYPAIICSPTGTWMANNECVAEEDLPLITTATTITAITTSIARLPVGIDEVQDERVVASVPVPGPSGGLLCPDAPEVENGVVSGGASIVGATRKVACLTGFTLIGSHQIICSPNAKWLVAGFCSPTTSEPDISRQEVVSCPDTFIVPNADVVAGLSHIGAERKIICNTGFTSEKGSQLIEARCSPQLKWIVSGSCIGKNCPDNVSVDGGVVSKGKSTVGSTRKFDCNSGFKLSGSDKLECGANFEWISRGLCSAIQCPLPPIVNNSNYESSRIIASFLPSFDVGTTMTFRCSRGFRLQGMNVVTCQIDGQWTKPGSCLPQKPQPIELVSAAANGNIVEMRRLISELGADVNGQCHYNVAYFHAITWTPLMLASFYGQTEAVRLLLEARADVNAINEEGWTALMMACNRPVKPTGTDLMDIAMLLVNSPGININALNGYQGTALYYAAKWGYSNLVMFLLERGASPSLNVLNTGANDTPLGVAMKNGKTHTAMVLSRAGASTLVSSQQYSVSWG